MSDQTKLTPIQQDDILFKHTGWSRYYPGEQDTCQPEWFVYTKAGCLPWPSLDALALIEVSLKEQSYDLQDGLWLEYEDALANRFNDGWSSVSFTFEQRREVLCEIFKPKPWERPENKKP